MNKIAEIRIKLRDRFGRFYTDDLVRISRLRHAQRAFAHKVPYCEPLTQSQKEEIIAFWKPYRPIDKQMKWFSFYNASCTDKSQLKYYIPDGVYFADFDMRFTSPRRSEHLDDKNLYDLYFHDVRMPRTCIRKINGQLFDKDYHIITMEQALKICTDAGKVITKEARLSAGGHGVRFFDFSQTTVEEFRNWISDPRNKNINVQEIIRQHESLSRIHPQSINSIRIISFLNDGKVDILSSLIRMGRDGATVDNTSQGGISCGIGKNGQLNEYAYNEYGKRFAQHPQGTIFKDTRIEGFDKCCDLIRSIAGRMYTTSGLISWDFAVGEDGEPILIEVNLTFGGIDIHQLCNGPIFGNRTEEMLSMIYHSKK